MSIISDKAVAYWELDEAWNAVHADTTANGYDLATGLVSPPETVLVICGKNASTFVQASYTYLVKTVTVADLSPSGSFQMTGWFRIRNFGTGYLVSKREDWVFDWPDYGIYSDGTNLRFQIKNAANNALGSVLSSVAMTTGIWYFWSIKHVNGVSISITVGPAGGTLTTDTVSWTGGVRSSLTSTFRLGKQDDTSQLVLDGYQSRVGFWSSPLTDDELYYLFGAGGCPPDWPFDAFFGDAGWRASVMRVRNLDDFSVQGYGAETSIVFTADAANDLYVDGNNLTDTDGLAAGDQAFLKVRRYGSDPNNIDTRRQTLVNVRLRIPIL